jgi:ElaB/YqjD/DUF883 family membrane-anchored ribosome-binding protein
MDKKENNEVAELKKEIETLKQNFLKLGDSLEKIVSQKIEENFEEIKNSVKDKIPKDRLDKIETLKIKGKDVAQFLKMEQELHPFLSILAAVGVGYLIGKVADKT